MSIEAQSAMTITPATLTRSAGVAGVAAGVIFIGVQLNHPQLDVASVHTTEWAVRELQIYAKMRFLAFDAAFDKSNQ